MGKEKCEEYRTFLIIYGTINRAQMFAYRKMVLNSVIFKRLLLPTDEREVFSCGKHINYFLILSLCMKMSLHKYIQLSFLAAIFCYSYLRNLFLVRHKANYNGISLEIFSGRRVINVCTMAVLG